MAEPKASRYAGEKHGGPNAKLREHLRRDHGVDDRDLRGKARGYKHRVGLERIHDDGPHPGYQAGPR